MKYMEQLATECRGYVYQSTWKGAFFQSAFMWSSVERIVAYLRAAAVAFAPGTYGVTEPLVWFEQHGGELEALGGIRLVEKPCKHRVAFAYEGGGGCMPAASALPVIHTLLFHQLVKCWDVRLVSLFTWNVEAWEGWMENEKGNNLLLQMLTVDECWLTGSEAEFEIGVKCKVEAFVHLVGLYEGKTEEGLETVAYKMALVLFSEKVSLEDTLLDVVFDMP